MNVIDYAWLIILAPLAGFLINGLSGKYLPEKAIGLTGSFASLISFSYIGLDIYTVYRCRPHPPFEIEIFTWFAAGKIHVPAAYLLIHSP
jgi:hypothetical protein